MDIVTDSTQLVRAFLEAEDIAENANHPLSSAHLLLALFTFPNRAQMLLGEQRVDEDDILDAIRALEDEPRRTVPRLRDRAREIAQGAGARTADCLHLLIAITFEVSAACLFCPAGWSEPWVHPKFEVVPDKPIQPKRGLIARRAGKAEICRVGIARATDLKDIASSIVLGIAFIVDS